ncbi:MAG: hypothetical protein Q4G00_00620 [Clostridia bacterium]|nr:hypothetical protein [Clostridia bacterium]
MKRWAVQICPRGDCFRWALALFAFEQIALKGAAWISPVSTIVFVLYSAMDFLIPCLWIFSFVWDVRRGPNRGHVAALAAAALLAVSAFVIRDTALLYSGIMILLARDLDTDKLLSALKKAVGAALALLLIGHFLGLTISQPVNFSYGMGYSMGMAHPNNFSAAVGTYLLLWAYLRREKPFWKTALILEAIGYLTFRFTLSRTSWIILLLYPAAYLFLRLPYRVRGEWLIRLIYLEFFALMAVSVFLMLYSENSRVLPVFFGDQNYLARFTSAMNLYRKHGVHLFGSFIEYRSLHTALQTGQEAVILDSAYLYLLIGQGASTLLLFLILISKAVQRLIRKRQFVLLAILALYLASGMMERYMLYSYMNFPLLAAMGSLTMEKTAVIFPAARPRRVHFILGRTAKTKYNGAGKRKKAFTESERGDSA